MKLKSISIGGYKTIRQLTFEPRSLNILIGVNAAGKSNFISFFRFLNWMLTPPGQLQTYVRDNGGASGFLYYGSEATRELTGELSLETEVGANEYKFRLVHVLGDTFAFAEEKYRFSRNNIPSSAPWTNLQPLVLEAGLNAKAEGGEPTARAVNHLIRGCVVHQFHNTSRNTRVKQYWNKDDNYYLKEDAANLAPFLRRLRENEPTTYQRIVETIRLVFPLFADFVLNPTGDSVLLQWTERGHDVVFSSYQASDGILRFFALAALLLQPSATMPDVLLIDEPELGLHPHALEVLAGLIQKASVDSQVIVSTQSAPLLSQFAPEDVVTVDRKDGESIFKRLSETELSAWLQEYTLGELWQKNYIEGATNG